MYRHVEATLRSQAVGGVSMKRGRLAAVFLALVSWLGSVEAGSIFVYGTGTDVINIRVEGPAGADSVAIVDPVVDPPGTADDWATPLRGTNWITPSELASGLLAEDATPGSYIYTFGITVPFLEDPRDPSRFDPGAKLNFFFFADNLVSDISLSDQFGQLRVVGDINIHDMNTLGEASLDLGFLRPALLPGDTYGAEVRVTVENFSLPDPNQRNPTGLDLAVLASTSVPEPSPLILLAIGGGILIVLQARRSAVLIGGIEAPRSWGRSDRVNFQAV